MTGDLKCYIGRIGLILYLLHPPASGVVAHEQFGGGGEVIGDEEGGLFAPVAPDNNLPQLPLVLGQRDDGLMDDRVGVFAFTGSIRGSL
jgi:hypothetical protein